MRPAAATKNPAVKPITAGEIYGVVFGLFLGLAIWKFGNPVILDKIIYSPKTWGELWGNAWPLHWANWVLLALAALAVPLALAKRPGWPGNQWLWMLPSMWFGWQVLSATQSTYSGLTTATLWQYAGCVACYFIGALVLGTGRRGFLLIGVLAAFAFCLVRAVDQKLFEFPREKQFFAENQRTGWTNVTPDLLLELKQESIIINTNGVDIANPAIIAKYEKGRVNGTLVYPNALGGIVLLLLPIAIVLAFQKRSSSYHEMLVRRVFAEILLCYNVTKAILFFWPNALSGLVLSLLLVIAVLAYYAMRRSEEFCRWVLIVSAFYLGLAALFWSGSKSGWLIALAAGVFWCCRLKWSRRLKWVMVTALVVGGLVVFAVRFQSYFAKGATSVGARFDYWRAAAQVTKEHPVFGTGPGTFQRPYASLKRPDAEMARLVHNDYLEQFSDSGVVGGICYAGWIGLLFWVVGRRVWKAGDWLEFGILAGLLAWFVQGFIEFSLFVPALAWTAFTLFGFLLARSGNQVDKSKAAD
jgi:hypothetical protein